MRKKKPLETESTSPESEAVRDKIKLQAWIMPPQSFIQIL